MDSLIFDRFQELSVNGVLSTPAPFISGVPQGSVVGLLLVIILIADINEETTEASIKSFADDTRAAKGIRYVYDIVILQQEMQKICKWSDKNDMELNDKKFEGTRYGPDEYLKMDSKYKTPWGKTST